MSDNLNIDALCQSDYSMKWPIGAGQQGQAD